MKYMIDSSNLNAVEGTEKSSFDSLNESVTEIGGDVDGLLGDVAILKEGWIYKGTASGASGTVSISDVDPEEICAQLMYSQKSVAINIPTAVFKRNSGSSSYQYFQAGGKTFEGEVYITALYTGGKYTYSIKIGDCYAGASNVSASVTLYVFYRR